MNKIPFIEKYIYRNIERLTFNENSLKLNMYFTLSSDFYLSFMDIQFI